MSDCEIQQALDSLRANPLLVWAPIRHHSPQCSFQLQTLFKQTKPDVVLIEGPSEANHLRPFLTDPACKPPVAFYLYGIDKQARWQSEGSPPHTGDKRYRCFMPFAAMSPEWQALKLAKRHKVPAHFIDLPYEQRLALNPQRDQHSQDTEQLLYAEQPFIRTDPLQQLIKASNCRDVDEWWDRHFESGVTPQSPRAYFDNLLRFCLLLRLHQPSNPEDEAREAYMATQIQKFLDQGQRCLVVTGAYHCYGIQQQLSHGIHKLPAAPDNIDSAVHLVPYSLQRLNSASGYSAGLPDCGYYANAWQQLTQHKPTQLKQAYAFANREQIILMANTCQTQGYLVSSADAIEAAVFTERLAALRQTHAGRSELRESLLSCFLKQAQDDSTLTFHHLMQQQLAGHQIGRVPKGLPQSPIVEDFLRHCHVWKLPLDNQVHEKNLDIYRSPRHQAISRLLHQLAFLGVPYAKRLSGPNFAQGTDLQRVREVWQLHWQVETQAFLTECSHWGSQVMDAALHKLQQVSETQQQATQLHVTWLINALTMGLHSLISPIIQRIQQWIRIETQAAALCIALNKIAVAAIGQRALGSAHVPELQPLISACYQRFCARLAWLDHIAPTHIDETCDALAEFFNVALDPNFNLDAQLFYDNLQPLLTQPSLAFKLKGVISGILLIAGYITSEALHSIQSEIFKHMQRQPEQLGEFFQGLIQILRGRILQEPLLLDSISQQLAQCDEDDFLTALPALRLAFTQLSPRETRDLWQNLWPDHQQSSATLDYSIDVLQAAHQLRQQVAHSAKYWGF